MVIDGRSSRQRPDGTVLDSLGRSVTVIDNATLKTDEHLVRLHV